MCREDNRWTSPGSQGACEAVPHPRPAVTVPHLPELNKFGLVRLYVDVEIYSEEPVDAVPIPIL